MIDPIWRLTAPGVLTLETTRIEIRFADKSYGICYEVWWGSAKQTETMHPNVTIANWNKPMSWTVNLDMMTALHVTHGGEEVVITAAEIFAALKS